MSQPIKSFMEILKRKFVAVISLAVCLGILAGCSTSIEQLAENQTDAELFEQGKLYYEQENYKTALRYFLSLKENFIRSSYAGLSRLYAGNCYFAQEKYTEAATEYKSYLMFFPDDPKAPEAQYKLGVSYFEQSRGPDRDQAILHTTLEELQKVRENYPDAAEFVSKTEEYIQKTRLELARHEFAVGMFYRGEQRYISSNGRFAYLIQEYPESDLIGDALYYQGLNYLDLQQPEEAKAAFSTLLQKYPENSHGSDARQYLKQLGVQENSQTTVQSDTSTVLSSERSPSVTSPQNAKIVGNILTIRDQTVTTNLIRDDGIREGIRLAIYREETLVGMLRITVIHEGFSMGEIEELTPGMVVREDDTVCCPL